MEEHSEIRFSVVIATFNQRSLVLETVQSVLQQTYPAHEVIVVADGCTDGTAEAIRSSFPQVTLIEQPNLGKCIARNTGIAAATGNWICLLDHDDLWHCEKLSTAHRYLKAHEDCQALSHPVWYFASSADGPAEGWGLERDFVAASLAECHQRAAMTKSRNDISQFDNFGRSFDRLLDRRLGAMSATLIRRDVVMRAGLFCPMQFNGEDWTLFVNVARLTEWHYIRERLGFSRLLRGSGTYDNTGGLMQLACQVNAWFGGRPLRHHTQGLAFLSELVKRRYVYRFDVQKYFWSAMWCHDFTLARLIRSAGQMLLPRWLDRAYVLVPPQITWRIERYLLGMHRPRCAPASAPTVSGGHNPVNSRGEAKLGTSNGI